MERTDRQRTREIVGVESSQRDGDHVGAVVDGSIEGSEDVSVIAAVVLADPVGGGAGSGRSTFGGAVGDAEDVGARDGAAGGGRERVSSVAIDVSGGVVTVRFRSPLGEISRSDQLPANSRRKSVRIPLAGRLFPIWKFNFDGTHCGAHLPTCCFEPEI